MGESRALLAAIGGRSAALEAKARDRMNREEKRGFKVPRVQGFKG
jgi:hypothetical protein